MTNKLSRPLIDSEPPPRDPTQSGLRPARLPVLEDGPAATALRCAAAAALAFEIGDEALGRELSMRAAESAGGGESRAVVAAVRLFAAHEIVARRRLALARGDERTARVLLEQVNAIRAAEAGMAAHDDDARLAARLLDLALRGGEARTEQGELVVGASGIWFALGASPRVDLRRRGALRRILDALVASRRAAPGQPLGLEDLVRHGWPGERMRVEAAAGRLYVAVRALRELGLRNVLLRQDSGYLLDPDVTVRVEA